MDQNEIQAQAQELQTRFLELLSKNMFVIVPEMVTIANSLRELQNQCNHNFTNGICEFCTLLEVDFQKGDRT